MRMLCFALLSSIFIVGCGNGSETPSPKIGISDFTIDVDVVVKKDDHFALYYSTDGSINFFTIKPLWKVVQGSKNVQRATFVIPGKIIPTQIRLDFGMNPKQPDVILHQVRLRYNGKIFAAGGRKVFRYFLPDKHLCVVDISTGAIKAHIQNGKRLTPALYPNGDALYDEIEKLTKR